MGLFEDIEERFHELPDGYYVVKIEDFSRDKTINGARPLKWSLRLIEEGPGELPAKFSHIETNAGFHILLRELRELGFHKPQNAKELEEILQSLKGSLVEIRLVTTNKAEGYRDIKLIRRLR
ncbi:MAG: hypothetical protein ACI4XL_10390 [Bacillus sp. (in: firmicutes)]